MNSERQIQTLEIITIAFLTVGLTCTVDSISLKPTVAGTLKASNCVSAVGINAAIGNL